MKRGPIALAILAAIAASVLGLTLASGSSASATPKPGVRPVVINCLGKPQVKPHEIVLACADGNSYLTGLAWTNWTQKLASASATLVQNDCVPYCAMGHFHRYPALVVLRGAASYQHGQRYTEITVTFPGPRPPVYNGQQSLAGPRSYTSALWAPPAHPVRPVTPLPSARLAQTA